MTDNTQTKPDNYADVKAGRAERLVTLHSAMKDRILVLDGAMGSLIQSYGLEEADFKGEIFAGLPQDLKGNNDLIGLTRPELLQEIIGKYLEAGADIIETNTFSATSIAQADYGLEDYAYQINRATAEASRAACDAWTAKDPSKPRFVTGVLGPTNKTASISPDVNDPGFRDITYDALVEVYSEAVRGLIDGGADMLLVETIFDTLNARAALFAIDQVCEAYGEKLPIMISGTISDLSGRLLSGQTAEAFWFSVMHARPLSIGLNCALGPKELRQYVAALSNVADCAISAHPNAGLPNEFGGYDLTPDDMAAAIGEWAQSGLLNIVGGCCGTTPDHIRAIAAVVDGVTPRTIPSNQEKQVA